MTVINQYILVLSLVLSGLAIVVNGRYANSKIPVAGSLSIFFLVVLLSAFYAVADYFTGNGIDESVLYHLQVGVEGAGVAAYKWLVVVNGSAGGCANRSFRCVYQNYSAQATA